MLIVRDKEKEKERDSERDIDKSNDPLHILILTTR